MERLCGNLGERPRGNEAFQAGTSGASFRDFGRLAQNQACAVASPGGVEAVSSAER